MKTLLVELKAKMNDLEKIKERLSQLGTQHVGKFHQIDTYFRVSQGRLKIRETEGQDSADIVFYERPNTSKIKKSQVLLLQAQPPREAKELLSKFFAKGVVVDKIREIYVLGKTRIHLDQVTQLGAFIEFELPTTNEKNEIEKSRSLLAELCAKLDVKKEDLEALSYSDFCLEK
jgi:predicted adenylyl cyclase CyaB